MVGQGAYAGLARTSELLGSGFAPRPGSLTLTSIYQPQRCSPLAISGLPDQIWIKSTAVRGKSNAAFNHFGLCNRMASRHSPQLLAMPRFKRVRRWRAATWRLATRTCRRELRPIASDNEARFGLGMIRFAEAIENFGQRQYRYGLRTPPNTMFPFFRLPVPLNPAPEEVTYEKQRESLRALLDDLSKVEATLAPMTASETKIVIDLNAVQFDFRGDGKPDSSETLGSILADNEFAGGPLRAKRNRPIRGEVRQQRRALASRLLPPPVRFAGICSCLRLAKHLRTHGGSVLSARSAASVRGKSSFRQQKRRLHGRLRRDRGFHRLDPRDTLAADRTCASASGAWSSQASRSNEPGQLEIDPRRDQRRPRMDTRPATKEWRRDQHAGDASPGRWLAAHARRLRRGARWNKAPAALALFPRASISSECSSSRATSIWCYGPLATAPSLTSKTGRLCPSATGTNGTACSTAIFLATLSGSIEASARVQVGHPVSASYRSTNSVSNPNRHRQASRIMWDGLNQATPLTLSKTERRPTCDGGVQDVFEGQTLLPTASRITSRSGKFRPRACRRSSRPSCFFLG